MFVRLSFSIFANLEPDVFIVDEALAVGDAYFRHRCMLRFHEMREAGTTILYVSHDAGSMKRLCDSVIWIENGTVREIGEPDRVADLYLASLFGVDLEGPAETEATSERSSPARPAKAKDGMPVFETSLPNIDRRRGDRRLEIQGVELYDTALRPTRSVLHGTRVRLRATVLNARMDRRADRWMLGYVLRNFTGEDLASANSQDESFEMPPLAPGERRTVWVELELPRLHPGPYSLTATVGLVEASGQAKLSDWIDNAIVFDVTATRTVNMQLSLETSFGVEPEATAEERSASSEASTATSLDKKEAGSC
jgi:hypothetical protein